MTTRTSSKAVFAFLMAFVVLLVPALAGAQADGDPAVAGPRTVAPVRVEAPPQIDGRLDDAVWQSAPRLDQFVQQRPVEGSPATDDTEVYIAYDSEYLYVAVYAHYSDTSLIRANRVDRDQTGEDDTVSVTIDPFLDAQRGYRFSANGYGIQADALVGGGGFGGSDSSWDVLYASAGMLVEDGWTAEMAIPFKSLRYPRRGADEVHRWGFQVERIVQGKDEVSNWSPVSSDVLGTLTQMGTLEQMSDLSTARNLEILPTATFVHAGSLDAAGRFGSDHIEEAGINVKYGLTSNLTFDFTYNPDFSQIESDRPQIEVNQRFAVFFPELRPFFLEGQEIFNVGIGPPIRLLHTRTIVDPEIGAKLTGKIGRTSVGLLVANDEAPGKLGDPTVRGYDETAKVVIGRVRHDLYNDSFAGVQVLDREFQDEYSRVVTFDSQFRLGNNYQLQAKYGTSRHRDAPGVERSGHLLDIMHRRVGRHFTYIVAQNDVTSGFRSDLGFISRTYRRSLANVGYQWWPESWLVNWGPRFTFDHSEDYDSGELQQQIRQLSISSLWARNITVNANFNVDRERFAGVDFTKHQMRISTNINTSRAVLVSFAVSHGDEVRFVADPFLGSTTGFNIGVTLRPSSRLQSELSLRTSSFTDLRTDTEVFDVKIYYAQTTYQFTDRLLLRNILEHNTLRGTVGMNLLATYRVNAGTVFFVGYDDRFQQGKQIDPLLYPTEDYTRTNRAVFMKLQYLYRRGS